MLFESRPLRAVLSLITVAAFLGTLVPARLADADELAPPVSQGTGKAARPWPLRRRQAGPVARWRPSTSRAVPHTPRWRSICRPRAVRRNHRSRCPTIRREGSVSPAWAGRSIFHPSSVGEPRAYPTTTAMSSARSSPRTSTGSTVRRWCRSAPSTAEARVPCRSAMGRSCRALRGGRTSEPRSTAGCDFSSPPRVPPGSFRRRRASR